MLQRIYHRKFGVGKTRVLAHERNSDPLLERFLRSASLPHIPRIGAFQDQLWIYLQAVEEEYLSKKSDQALFLQHTRDAICGCDILNCENLSRLYLAEHCYLSDCRSFEEHLATTRNLPKSALNELLRRFCYLPNLGEDPCFRLP